MPPESAASSAPTSHQLSWKAPCHPPLQTCPHLGMFAFPISTACQDFWTLSARRLRRLWAGIIHSSAFRQIHGAYATLATTESQEGQETHMEVFSLPVVGRRPAELI